MKPKRNYGLKLLKDLTIDERKGLFSVNEWLKSRIIDEAVYDARYMGETTLDLYYYLDIVIDDKIGDEFVTDGRYIYPATIDRFA